MARETRGRLVAQRTPRGGAVLGMAAEVPESAALASGIHLAVERVPYGDRARLLVGGLCGRRLFGFDVASQTGCRVDALKWCFAVNGIQVDASPRISLVWREQRQDELCLGDAERREP